MTSVRINMHRVATLGENRQLGYFWRQKIRPQRPATFGLVFETLAATLGDLQRP